jgi:hypothetical protein
MTREYFSSQDLANLTKTRVQRYDESGHVVAYAERSIPTDAYSSWRLDFRFDEHGNQIERTMRLTNTLDVLIVPDSPYSWSERDSHTYDPSGRLLVTSVSYAEDPGMAPTTYTYSTDALGRCETISGGDPWAFPCLQTNVLGYQSDRLVRSEQTCSCDWLPGTMYVSVTELTFDEQGRRLNVGFQCTGMCDNTVLPFSDVTHSYAYANDGTVTVTYPDSMSDTPSAEFPADYVMPPDCITLVAKLPQLTGNACRYPLEAFWLDPLIW